MLGVPPISSLRTNSILVTGMSPLMLKARLMGSKTSSTTGASTTEELLEEDSGTELSELLELLLTGLEEETELEEAGLEEEAELEETGLEEETELETEELAELEELLELLEEEEPLGLISLMPLLFQTAVKATSMLGAPIRVPEG